MDARSLDYSSHGILAASREDRSQVRMRACSEIFSTLKCACSTKAIENDPRKAARAGRRTSMGYYTLKFPIRTLLRVD